MSDTIICEDCQATTLPCNCCEWCEMYPCECVDDDDDADTIELTPAQQADLRERFADFKAKGATTMIELKQETDETPKAEVSPTLRKEVADAFVFHTRVKENLRTGSLPKQRKAVDMAFQDGMQAAYQDVLNMLERRGQ